MVACLHTIKYQISLSPSLCFRMFSGHSYHKLKGDLSRSNTTSTRRSRRSATTASRLSPVPEQAKTSTLTMKVNELRSWLSEVGDKHQEHYHRFDHHSPPRSGSSSKHKPPTSECGKDDLLGIQSRPSMTSTCPSTAIVEENDPLFGASFSSDDDDDSSNQEGRRSDLYHQTNGESARKLFDDEGVEHVTSKAHLALLLKQAPRDQEKGIYCSVNHAENCYDDDNRDDDDSVALRNNGPSMHNSHVFRDQLLTKATLDAMSRSLDNARKTPKTLGEQLQQLDKDQQQHQQQRTLVTPGLDSADSNTNTDSFGLSTSTDSTDAPSIAPGVLVSKMANIFLNQHGNGNTASTRDCEQTVPPPPPPVERRRYVNPEDLSFLRSSNCSSNNSACSVAQREDLAYAKPPQTPPTTVGKGIRKFGGPRKTLVERRKKQLHEKFGETRGATFVHKKTWDQKTAHGKYKRTTTVEKLYK